MVDKSSTEHDNILVVTHGMNIHCILQHLTSQKEQYDLGDWGLDPHKRGGNTSVTRMSVRRSAPGEGINWKIQLECVKDSSHLS